MRLDKNEREYCNNNNNNSDNDDVDEPSILMTIYKSIRNECTKRITSRALDFLGSRQLVSPVPPLEWPTSKPAALLADAFVVPWKKREICLA